MKLLANAHISHSMVEFLRSVGHDCMRAEELKPGMPDEELVSIAHREGRVIVTADKDSDLRRKDAHAHRRRNSLKSSSLSHSHRRA